MLRICALLQVFIAIDTWTASEVLAAKHRCYVCIPNTGSSISDVLQMFPKTPDVPFCNQFALSKPEFVRECPDSSNQGCLTQTNGTHVTKTCTEVGLEDCKTANKIEYCYCKGDLCNKEAVPAEAEVPEIVHRSPPGLEIDDEDDLSEGSGTREVPDFKETTSEIYIKHFPPTTKSAVLTTRRPDPSEPEKANGTPSTRPHYILYTISFLLLFKG